MDEGGANQMINGVILQPLKQFADQRGRVMHMLRADSPLFTKFGEIYFSEINAGIIKGWKRHLQMTQLFAVPIGKVRFVLYDDREGSATRGELQTVEIGEDNYSLLRIPRDVWYSFKGLRNTPSLIANCADIPHDPKECVNKDPKDPAMPNVWGNE